MAANMSSRGRYSPSSYPSELAIAPLDVAIAANPASANTRALVTSQALGKTTGRPGTCSDPRSAAFSTRSCELRIIGPCSRMAHDSHRSTGRLGLRGGRAAAAKPVGSPVLAFAWRCCRLDPTAERWLGHHPKVGTWGGILLRLGAAREVGPAAPG